MTVAALTHMLAGLADMEVSEVSEVSRFLRMAGLVWTELPRVNFQMMRVRLS